MNSVEKVKALCKERKIPISHLEKALGYGNGYIGSLKKGSFPDDRLVEIANYLKVSTSYLTGEEQKEQPATVPGDELSENKRYLLESVPNLSEAQAKMLRAVIEQVLEETAH